MKKIVIYAMLCIVAFWSARIYSVNKEDISNEVYFEPGDIVSDGGMQYTLTESKIYTIEEYEQLYDTDQQIIPAGNKVLCACLEITNNTSEELSWDDVMQFTIGGFEMTTWASTPVMALGRPINTFETKALEPGASQKVWYATGLFRQSFKEKTWKNIKDCEFYYIPTFSPEKIMYRMYIE